LKGKLNPGKKQRLVLKYEKTGDRRGKVKRKISRKLSRRERERTQRLIATNRRERIQGSSGSMPQEAVNISGPGRKKGKYRRKVEKKKKKTVRKSY